MCQIKSRLLQLRALTSLVLVDTGPLVAMRSENETSHAECLDTLKTLPQPLLTCWPVLTEAAFLLRKHPLQVRELLASADGRFLRILPIRHPDVLSINAILEKYEDQAIQLADAALVHLAKRENIDTVFTLDRRDFGILRTEDGKTLNIIPALAA